MKQFANPPVSFNTAASPVNAGAAVPANLLVMPSPRPVSTPEDRADYDEYARLVDATRKPNARKEVLRKRILAQYDHLLPAESAVARGDEYDLDIPMKGNETKVTGLAKLWKYLGMKKFIAICKVTIEAFEAHVPAEDRPQFLTLDRTGGRQITCSKRFKEAA